MNDTSGVYKITNIVTGDFYVGSACGTGGFRKRWILHRHTLNNNVSHSLKLQNAWNKYGEVNFTFSVVEECNKDITIQREQYYLDMLKPAYNICTIATNCLGVKRSLSTKQKIRELKLGVKRKPFTEEHKKNMRESQGRRGPRTPHSVATREKLRKVALNREHSPMLGKKMSEDAKRKMSDIKPKQPVIDQNGVIYPSQTAAARALGLCQGNISAVVRGVASHVYGYVFKKA